MQKKETKPAKTRVRYGIGEWYGRLFDQLSPEARKEFTAIQFMDKENRSKLACPFRADFESGATCTKEGGVCSLRMYALDPGVGSVRAIGSLVTTCPNRFLQQQRIFEWIGETLLGSSTPRVVSQIGFLQQEAEGSGGDQKEGDVGRIDNVLVHPTLEPFNWCAVEIQAVYFSGATMRSEFKLLQSFSGPGLPFPARHRRPDFRSSGPKRLMPQLQIKVPTLRRWGKKMAVVVDRVFFDSLGAMDNVRHVSNCDIAWFVVRFADSEGQGSLEPDFVRLTTLERAVEGLTGGIPVSLETFEERIRKKLSP